MTPLSVPAPAAIAPQVRSDKTHTAPVAVPDLATMAVTAAQAGGTLRNDPDRASVPQGPAVLPAPLKGLGIPPLNTRQVGDFDKLDDPLPPMGIDLPDRLADLDGPPAPTLDLRR